ncbi:MAG: hypothetical protein QF893_19020, partial [Alphaproteobacteria bacterium]|nr:hypothetical protein [Alphaproteobacteria bacterium]
MTVNPSIPNTSLSYLSGFDPWRPCVSTDLESLLKVAAITNPRMVISDNQALNNAALQTLLLREDVFDFLRTPDESGSLPVSISFREGTSSFEEVAARLVLNREKPAIFPWMNASQQVTLDMSYSNGSRMTLGPLMDIAGKGFQEHLQRLDSLVSITEESRSVWSGLENGYVFAAEKSLQKLQSSFVSGELQTFDQHGAIALCEALLMQIQKGGEINRSMLYRTISSSDVDARTVATIRLKALDEPYHSNFAASGRYNIVTGDEYRHARVAEAMQCAGHQLATLKPIDVIEIDQFPVALDQVPLNRIHSLRSSSAYRRLLVELVATEDEHKRVRTILDILNFISAEFDKEKSTLGK